MNDELKQTQKGLQQRADGGWTETVLLYPGVELSYLTMQADSICAQRTAWRDGIEINYCKTGRIAWQMDGGDHIYLGPGNFAVRMIGSCRDATITLPTGLYEGLTLFVDLQKLFACPPEPLVDADGIEAVIRKNVCGRAFTSFQGNGHTETIFSGFYHQSEHLRLAYQKLKALELLLYLGQSGPFSRDQLTEYQSEQVEIIRKIHQQMVAHMEQKITIEELSRQYLINPTTLKETFKAVYGRSIAAHIKQHRMEQAAKLLRETDLSIAEIAQAVGYDSQSRFTAAFKSFFQVVPREYRK